MKTERAGDPFTPRRWWFGRADARYFQFAGVEWIALNGGTIWYIGIGGVLVFYVCRFRPTANTPPPPDSVGLATDGRPIIDSAVDRAARGKLVPLPEGPDDPVRVGPRARRPRLRDGVRRVGEARPVSRRPSTACTRPWCPCRGTIHGRAMTRGQDDARRSARWRRERADFLAFPGNDRCHLGVARDCRGTADTVHHVQPPKGDLAAFWDHRNWLAVCGPCNSAHDIAAEGGFRGSWAARRRIE